MATAKEKAANKAMKAKLGYDEWGNDIPLPNKPTYASRHPRQAATLEMLGGVASRAFPGISAATRTGIDAMDSLVNPPQMYGEPQSQAAPQAGPLGASVEMPLLRPDEFAPMPMRNPSRDYQQMHNLGRAGALKQVIGGYIHEINNKYGVEPGEAETLLHDFADSEYGRKITDVLVRGKRDRDLESKSINDYKKFISSFKAQTTKSKTVNIPKPVPVQARMIANETNMAKVIKAVDKKPALITDASDLGFNSDRVLVIKGDAPVADPEAVLNSQEVPVVSQAGFIDIMKYLRQ